MFGLFKKKYPSDLTKLTDSDIRQIFKEEGAEKGGDILREAANLGNLPSQCALSILYLTHLDKITQRGDQQNIAFIDENAEHFTKLAAEQNDNGSQYNLAKYYLKKGTFFLQEADNYYTEESKGYFRKAEYWFKSSFKNGNQEAMNELSSLAEIFEISNN